MDLDLGLDPIGEEYVTRLHPAAALAIVHIPIAVALVATVRRYVQERREQRRLWEPAVMYPYVVEDPRQG
jgi:hypothetical protein